MSLCPIAQIDIDDFPHVMHVYIQNKGVGPMTIRRLTFFQGKDRAETIEAFIPIEPQRYLHTNIIGGVHKSILSHEKFIVFQVKVSDASEEQKESFRRKLAGITVEVDYMDIYQRRFTIRRSFDFFLRHAEGTRIAEHTVKE